MKLKYEYKGEIFIIKIKNIEKLQSGFKLSLKRKLKISINDYLIYLGFNVEKCRICKIGNVPVDIKYEIINDFIIITDFTYTKKIYCYMDNDKCDGIKMNSNSFEFISKIENISIEEATKLLKARNNSPFYKENWKSESDYKEYQKRGLNYFIKKYGENGQNEYNIYKNKISYSNSIDRYINEFGEKEGKMIFNKISSSKDTMSYFYFIKKNKNDKKAALIEYNNRLKSVDVSIKNWIKIYGEKEALKKHKERVEKSKETFNNNPNKEIIYKSRGITINNLYKKYGNIDIAKKKHKEWLKKITVPFIRASKESLLIFLPIIEELNKIGIYDIYIGYKEKNEYFIRDDNNIYFYDFTIRDKKIIIEYNGILFHPKNENSNWINPFNKNITSKEAYNKQKYKIDLAKKNGFSVLEIWSDCENNYEKCLKFIKENI